MICYISKNYLAFWHNCPFLKSYTIKFKNLSLPFKCIEFADFLIIKNHRNTLRLRETIYEIFLREIKFHVFTIYMILSNFVRMPFSAGLPLWTDWERRALRGGGNFKIYIPPPPMFPHSPTYHPPFSLTCYQGCNFPFFIAISPPCSSL